MTDSTRTLTDPTTHTLEVPGAVITYDIRSNDESRESVLVLIGSPMGASGFPTLASHFADRTVVTYDPRGADRSKRTDGRLENTTEEHADDVHRVIEAVGSKPVDRFASSGGAVNVLELVARHPADVRVLVAHEPPDAAVLPDREEAFAAIQDLRDTYERSGFGAAMAKFIALTSLKGRIPADFADRPAPDPAMFGMPPDDGSRTDPLFAQNMFATTRYEPDIEALRRAPTRIVMAAGEESEDQFTWRATAAIANRLGTELVVFPGGHGGFQGNEYGMPGKPDEFAAKLREVLSATS
jgi:pimeloyl-ACP methyl ester carboxylesterase